MFNTYETLLGDTDNDWDIDTTDLNAFTTNFTTLDIGPATGAAPYMTPAFDQVSDIYDVNVFQETGYGALEIELLKKSSKQANTIN